MDEQQASELPLDKAERLLKEIEYGLFHADIPADPVDFARHSKRQSQKYLEVVRIVVGELRRQRGTP